MRAARPAASKPTRITPQSRCSAGGFRRQQQARYLRFSMFLRDSPAVRAAVIRRVRHAASRVASTFVCSATGANAMLHAVPACVRSVAQGRKVARPCRTQCRRGRGCFRDRRCHAVPSRSAFGARRFRSVSRLLHGGAAAYCARAAVDSTSDAAGAHPSASRSHRARRAGRLAIARRNAGQFELRVCRSAQSSRSRFRRQAAQMRHADFCVSSRYPSRQPAAPIASACHRAESGKITRAEKRHSSRARYRLRNATRALAKPGQGADDFWPRNVLADHVSTGCRRASSEPASRHRRPR